jgi:hypothetical protein
MYFGKRGAGEITTPLLEKTDKGMLYRSQWDGMTIEMKKGSYSEEKYVRNLRFLSSQMERIIRFTDFNCEKKTIFGLIDFIRSQIKELNKRNIKHIVGNPDTIPVVSSCK